MATVIEIQDLSLPQLDVYARLTESAARTQSRLLVVESAKVIRIALEAGLRPVSFLMERRQLDGAGRDLLARCGETPVYTGARETLARLTGYALTRGMLCAMERPALPPAEALLPGANRIAVLEGLTDATNVGAVFRSAAALGIDAVLLAHGCCDPLTRRSIRVSMGTVFQVPWSVLPPEADPVWLSNRGFATVALALRDDARPIDDPRLSGAARLAVYLGAEGDGLSAHTVSACDFCARIPMSHGVDSLNVAAASAVAFWQLRQRPSCASADTGL